MGKNHCTITVQTGVYKGAPTDANVFIILHDERGNASPQYKLDHFFRNDCKCPAIDKFEVEVPEDFDKISMIELWCDNDGCTNWYVDTIKVDIVRPMGSSIFPISRWIQAPNSIKQNHYRIYEIGTILPQFDPNLQQRENEIKRNREKYVLNYNKYKPNMPILVKKLPADEDFSWIYSIYILLSKYTNLFMGFVARILIAVSHFYDGRKRVPGIKRKKPQVKELPADEDFSWIYYITFLPNKLMNYFEAFVDWILITEWNSFEDIKSVYDIKRKKPQAADHWDTDEWFGNQRLVGCNPSLITLCTEIPEKFGVNEEMMKPILNGETLASLMEKKRLFLIDLEVLEGVNHIRVFEICAPIALFMLNDDDQLMPIAIQLKQEKGPENPVFLPTDDHYVWLMAKMWYNNADASYHQSVFHLGWTHFLMEGVIVAIHRNISVSHPIFKLMAPHTLFTMAINSRALERLVSHGGWVDSTMAIGAKGMYELVGRCQKKWRFDLHGTPPAEFKSRNVEDQNVLPNYHFRDDSLLIYDIIKTYVTNYVKLYYDNDKMLLEDWEIQNWAKDLAKEKSEGGIGLAGVPEKDGKPGFYNIDDLVMVLSSIIYTCSAHHAAASFLQYAEYAYPPNYPSQIRGEVIKDKNPITEKYIIWALPDPKITISMMSITDMLSAKETNSLGDFETQYIYDPKALKVLAKFQDDLMAASKKITERNNSLRFPYEVLLPENIPNAISI